MRFYWPIAKIDAEQRMVWGYATTEAPDDQGETVTREAMAAALDGYMRFANIREMHQNSAVGVAKEAAIDDRGLYIGAKIVDNDAWRKVTEGVYNGFSIGGRVTARDPADRTLITGLALTEISVVDRPANPEAVFDCWKLAAGTSGGSDDCMAGTRRPNAAVAQSGRARLDRLRQRVASGSAEPASIETLQAAIRELCDVLAMLAAEREAEQTAAQPGQTPSDPPGADQQPLLEAVAKLAEWMAPRLDALQRRVDDIANTPMPPQTVGRGLTAAAISKRDDATGAAVGPDDLVAALARMTDEERTLTLIKAARANPVAPVPSGLPGAGWRANR